MVTNEPTKKWSGNNMLLRWGNSNPLTHKPGKRLGIWLGNDVVGLQVAKHKTRTFDVLKAAGVNCPEYTTDTAVAQQWLTEGAVLKRDTATGQGGAGITLFERGNQYPQVVPVGSFAVKYIKKMAEYRVHVFDGEVIRVQQKRRQAGFEGRNNQVRNHANGWVFCTENVQAPDALKDIAIKAVGAVGLTFGAVDVIWNAREDKYYVLEINTAPGLEGETIKAYGDAVRKYAAKMEGVQ